MLRCFSLVSAFWLTAGITLLAVGMVSAAGLAVSSVSEDPRLALLEIAAFPQGAEVVVDPRQRLEVPRERSRETIAIAPFVGGRRTATLDRPVSATVVRMFRLPESTFGADQHHLSRQGEKDLSLIADTLRKESTGYLVRIDGHTDNQGSDSYNEKLARERAVTAGMHLALRNGISPDRLFVKGVGEKEPIDSNRTEDGRSRNRRLEVLVLRPSPVVR